MAENRADNETDAKTASPSPEGEDHDAARPSSAWKIGLVFVALAGVVVYALVGGEASKAFVYSKLVHEVMANPKAFEGRELRVEGQLKQGSIQFREQPCEWRFVIEKQGKEMPVRFPQCVVPDTFRDGMGISVTVQGKLEASGDTFLANQVVPRCPSKYEMQQRQKNGEKMPHDAKMSGMGQAPQGT